MSDQALADLKVLEYGDLVSVPYCGKLMADLGAEVIKSKIRKPVMWPGIEGHLPKRSPGWNGAVCLPI